MTRGLSKSPSRQHKASAREQRPDAATAGIVADHPDASYKSLLDSAAVATMSIAADGGLVYASPKAQALFKDLGSRSGAAISDAPRLFDDTRFGSDLRAALKGDALRPREVLAADGRWFLRQIVPHRAPAGGAVISFTEISALKKAEHGIKLARAYLDSILGTIRQPLVVLDPDGAVISASGSFYRLFEIPPAELVGKRLTAAIRCLDVPAFRSFLHSIEEEGATVEDCEMDIAVAEIGMRTFAISARVLREEDASERKILIAIVDVTQARHEGEKMQAARLEAERANLGKSKFLAAASHDLRQPLQTMSLIQGLLEKRVSDETTRGLVRRLDETISTMSSMLDKLLDINQLETGTVRPEVRTFPLAVLFDELRSEFLFHTATRQLDWRVVSSTAAVRSDPRLLEQILRNLLANAVKYTARGRILLGCRRHGDRLRIEIWDTGVGIPEAELTAIFNEFHQLSNPARERARGLGLGLSIVRRLSGLLEHPISVRSVLGGGSVFAIEVPTGELPPTASPVLEGAPQAAIAREGIVLIVEDDPDLREMLQSLFESEGLNTLAYGEAAPALATIKARGITPDLVVADYNLPGGLSGIDLISKLQAGATQPPRAILLTGDISTKSLREIAHHDCVHISKPVLSSQLLHLSRTLLSRAARDQQPVRAPEMQDDLAATSMVYVVDDDTRLRETIRDVLIGAGHEVATFDSGEAFLASQPFPQEGCLIIDAMLPGLNGIDVITQMRARGSSLPVVVVTGHGAVPMAVAAMQAGAVDFIEKPVSGAVLVASVARAVTVSAMPSIAKSEAEAKMVTLTARQKQIMNLILAGHPNKNIAADLAISQRTVENHRAAIMRKTESTSLADLVRTALISTGR